MSPADPKDGTLVVAVCHSPDHDTGPHLHGNLGWFAPVDPVSASLEPRTDAGKALLQSFAEIAEHQAAGLPFIKPPARFISTGRDAILAIEEQAATEARRELLAALTGLVERVNAVLAHPTDDALLGDLDGYCDHVAARLIEESDRDH